MIFSCKKNFFIAFLIMLFYQLSGAEVEKSFVVKFIESNNYSVEIHQIETKDGYILESYRIISPKNNSAKKNNNTTKEVILFGHGMGGLGENFIMNGPENSLGFYFADRDYDVWLFNSRGTVHSRRHKTLHPNRDRKKFWNFSWHEIAVYDLSATVNYITETTGVESLFYVGHSQGTTILFVMLSVLPEMNGKIKAAGLLAPSAFLNYTRAPILTLGSRLYKIGERVLSIINWYELPMPNSPSVNSIFMNICKHLTDICMDIIYLIAGGDTGMTDKALLPLFIQFGVSGLSSKQAWHYSQVISTGEFKQYDYGAKKNLKIYGQNKPPEYQLENIKVPLALFYHSMDPFSNEMMVEALMKKVPNVVLDYEVPIKSFNHFDYIIANKAKKLINEPLYELFSRYENK